MVMRQAGRADLAASLVDLGSKQPAWRVLAAGVAEWSSRDPQQRLLIACALNCLTMQADLLSWVRRIPHPAEPGSSEQLTYELSRGLQQLHRNREASGRAFAFLAEEGKDMSIRVLACTQLAARAMRAKKQNVEAYRWLSLGAKLLPRLDQDDFARLLVASRYHRCVALYHTRTSNASGQASALERATEADAQLEYVCGPSGARSLVARENRRILLESQIKAAIGNGSEVGAANELIDRFEALDPWCPETLYFSAVLLERTKQLDRAAHYYMRAAEMGTARGIQAAAAAQRCYQALARTDQADLAGRLGAELTSRTISELE